MLGIRSRGRGLALALGTGLASCLGPPPSVPPGPPASAPPPSATPDDTGDGEPGAPYFSGAAALARVEVLMGWPRGLGDPRRERSIDALAQMLEMAGAEAVERQPLRADDPATGQSYDLVNLIAHLRPDAPRRFVLATHFDTRPWADEEEDPAAHELPVPGANDGTSGVAVLLVLLPTLAEALPPEVGVTVILFDGEELGRPGYGGYCMGSRHFAAQAAEQRPAWLERAELGIVLDMVGDRDLHLPKEPLSIGNAPALVDRLWAVARRRGHAQFEDRRRPVGILDDHELLTEAGVPSVLLIDKEYAPWHTRGDVLAELSAESLAAVGDTVLHALLELASEPPLGAATGRPHGEPRRTCGMLPRWAG
ncbi:MAG: M28 family peptidase [Myxococcales bacterium]|nr:M28 family peptidase [Myxococcales bacterium]MCB9718442.1 M28 family peptidase [Myxococcales bacterium]